MSISMSVPGASTHNSSHPPASSSPLPLLAPVAAPLIDARKQELLEARLAGQAAAAANATAAAANGSSYAVTSSVANGSAIPASSTITITSLPLHLTGGNAATLIPLNDMGNSPVKNFVLQGMNMNSTSIYFDLQPNGQLIAQPTTLTPSNSAANLATVSLSAPATPAEAPVKDDSNVSIRSTSSHSGEKDLLAELPSEFRGSANSNSITQTPPDSTPVPEVETKKRKRTARPKEPRVAKGMKAETKTAPSTPTSSNGPSPSSSRKLAEYYKQQARQQGTPVTASVGTPITVPGQGSRSPLHLQSASYIATALQTTPVSTPLAPATVLSLRPLSATVACQTDLLEKDIKNLFNQKSLDKADKDKTVQAFELRISELQKEAIRYKHKLELSEERLARCVDMEKKLLSEKSAMEKKSSRSKSVHNRMKLGQFVTQREGANFEEKFLDGYAFNEIHKRMDELQAEKEELDRRKKTLQKRKPTDKSNARKGSANLSGTAAALLNNEDSAGSSSSGSINPAFGGISAVNPNQPNGPSNWTTDFIQPETEEFTWSDYYQEDEILKLRTAQLKKDEQDCQGELEKLERERLIHIRELKRIYNEDQSVFKNCPVLNKHYLLLSLIGKGGFSEVHKAFDLDEQRYVAVKVHQLIKEWKEEKKVNYIKHALREYHVHKHLTHPRVVKLYDVFEIDSNSFATVLEYVEGNDLDFYLKQQKTIPEREARAIICQVVSALKYFNKLKPPIIHYDLKPGNILLGNANSSGEIKVTDFGLSKVCDDEHYDSDCGMDLTSQGAGTYWYLPPEVFETSNTPKISSKVDVWSVGVIFYQMLYGKKPYGDKQSQREVLQNFTILNAKEVEFPPKPPISLEAKNFIRRCLTLKKDERPEVRQLVHDEYLQLGTKLTKGSSASAAQASAAQQASAQAQAQQAATAQHNQSQQAQQSSLPQAAFTPPSTVAALNIHYQA